jgi:hypothetical protein
MPSPVDAGRCTASYISQQMSVETIDGASNRLQHGNLLLSITILDECVRFVDSVYAKKIFDNHTIKGIKLETTAAHSHF